MIRFLLPALALGAAGVLSLQSETRAQAPANRLTPVPHTMKIADGKFLFGDKPVQYLCGEMHYFQISRGGVAEPPAQGPGDGTVVPILLSR